MTDLQYAAAALACFVSAWTLVAVTAALLWRDRRDRARRDRRTR